MRKREIQDRSERLKSALLANRFATEEEIAQYWPKHPEWGLGISAHTYLKRYPTGDHAARAAQVVEWDHEYEWLVCMGHMWRLWGERNALLRPDSEHAREKVLAGMLAEPRDVLLMNGEKTTVFPKSYDCLRFCSVRGAAIEFLRERRDMLAAAIDNDTLEADEIPEPFALVEAIEHAMSDLDALLCWVATSPGPYLPWVEPEHVLSSDPWTPDEPTPQKFYQLNAVDVVLIREVFQEVNFLPLHYLPRLSGKKRNGKSDWDGLQSFFASRSRRRGVPAKYLMMHEPFVSQVVEDTLSTASIEEALG